MAAIFAIMLTVYLGGSMDSIQTFIRRAERDVAVTEALRRVLRTIRLLHVAQLEVANTGIVIDLSSDIERLLGALLLLGYSEQ
jgi:hypothetical protein